MRQTVAQVVTDYDLDSDDEAWITKFNTRAAAKASRARDRDKSQDREKDREGAGGGAGGQAQAPAPALNADLFETLIQKLELAHFEALKAKSELWQAEVKVG